MRCPSCDSLSVEQLALRIEGDIVLRRCRSCGLIFHLGFADADVVQNYYAHYYDRPDVLAFNPITDKRYRALIAQFEPYRTAGRILDVGCGSGHLLSVALAHGWEAHGVEVAAGPLEELRKRGIHCFHGELKAARYASGSFDVVHCSEMLEHVLAPAALLGEIGRVLRDGGLLYFTTPNFDSLSRRLLGAKWRVLCREHVLYFTPRVLARTLSRAGFDPVTTTSRNLDPTECRKLFQRRRLPSTSGFQATSIDHLRDRLELNPALRLMKYAVNGLLSATASGDTIIARAVKAPAARSRPEASR